MTLVVRGKVREVHDAGDDRLVIVTSDRISAYDVVLPTAIPGKGQMLTGLSAHWFARTAGVVANHMIASHRSAMPTPWREPEFAGRTMLVRRLDMLPVECVVRGYLAGSGWLDYTATGAVCGNRLPAGLRQADRLPVPLFTPATKALEGHDENIDHDALVELVGYETALALATIATELYERAAADCLKAGIILADTKFEFGRDSGGNLVLADEVVTPDSSRFWSKDTYGVDQSPPSFDKQYVRDWLVASGWDRMSPAPELPREVVDGTRSRYREAYERLTSRTLESWIEEATR
ncbi:MAG: phosphoribosylaminoimidazolesuccinocarboxamide synthase [Actinobacteria bacterium]|nr:phosphoribosylaminoimidazolesuccinocarboxamide synthase [Actinomycetota bacterium]